jgi:hypothetical protein
VGRIGANRPFFVFPILPGGPYNPRLGPEASRVGAPVFCYGARRRADSTADRILPLPGVAGFYCYHALCEGRAGGAFPLRPFGAVMMGRSLAGPGTFSREPGPLQCPARPGCVLPPLILRPSSCWRRAGLPRRVLAVPPALEHVLVLHVPSKKPG